MERFLELSRWQIEQIKKGPDEARSGTPGVPHEEVEARVRSWGTRNERERPKPPA